MSDTVASSKNANQDYTIIKTAMPCLTMKEPKKGASVVGRRKREEGSQKK